MAEYSFFKLTTAAKSLLTKVAEGATLSFSRWGIASGTINFPDDVPGMTALVNEEMSHPISEVKKISATQYSIKGYVTPEDFPETGFYMRQYGVFAMDPDDGEILYGVVYTGNTADYMPSAGSGSQFGVPMNVVVTVGDTDNVTVVVELAAAASKQDISDHEAKQLDWTSDNPEKNKHWSDAQAKQVKSHLDDKNDPHEIGYTAADVLAKLKGVDGHECGLDADLLDGYHVSSLLIADYLNSVNGYAVLPLDSPDPVNDPKKLIIQWGYDAATPEGSPVVFPIAFPTEVFSFVCGDNGADCHSQGAGDMLKTGFSFHTSHTSLEYAFWIAVGR
ncbi:MAG: phage tail protein [Desulfobacterales bacterium]|nr:phage tail protein [Desulfobacterales bacterium]